MGVPRSFRPYGWSVVSVLVAAAVVALGPPLFRAEALGFVFLAAVFASIALGGTGPGYAAIVLSILAANGIFLTLGRDLLHPDNLVGEAIFLSVSFILVTAMGLLRRTLQALRASEKRFRTAQELSLDAFTVLRAVRDKSGRIVDFEWTYANPTAERLLRHTGLAGKRLLEVLPGNRKNGDLFERYVRITESGESDEVELRYDADGIAGWFRNMAVKLDDGVAVSFGDITQRVEAQREREELNQHLEERVAQRTAELTRSQEALKRSERLVAIGQMMAGLSHESRNALQRSLACIEMLQRRVKDEAPLMHLIAEMRKAQEELMRVYDGVQDYARPLKPNAKSVDVAQLWRETWDTLLSRQGRDARLVEEPGSACTVCEADSLQLEQVFRNLFENALAASPDPVEIRVRCEDAEFGRLPALRIRLRDNGPGLSSELQAHVFEPFFTTKTKGTGLGLPVVRRIIEAHEGQVEVESSPGEGFEVLIYLPKLQQKNRSRLPH